MLKMRAGFFIAVAHSMYEQRPPHKHSSGIFQNPPRSAHLQHFPLNNSLSSHYVFKFAAEKFEFHRGKFEKVLPRSIYCARIKINDLPHKISHNFRYLKIPVHINYRRKKKPQKSMIHTL